MTKTPSKKNIKTKPVFIPNFTPNLSKTAPEVPATNYEIQKQFENYANAKIAKESKDPKELTLLSKNISKSVKFWVANNKNTPPEVLAELAKFDSFTIKAAVAQNESTPSQTIIELKDNEDSDIARNALITYKKQIKNLMKLWLK